MKMINSIAKLLLGNRKIFLLGLLITVLSVSPSFAALNWLRQFGTSGSDSSYDVSVDGLGNVYVSGYTNGDLGGSSAGNMDEFLRKYTVSGSLVWTQQTGTSGSEYNRGVAADSSGNVFTVGITGTSTVAQTDIYLNKYDTSGDLVWSHQFGTSSNDYSEDVALDSMGNVYITGQTWGNFGGTNAGYYDAFLSKYDSSGELLWATQWGFNCNDRSKSVTVDNEGNVYIAGTTETGIEGPNEAFLNKYNASGTLLWSRQMGSSGTEYGTGVSVDNLGNVYVSGITGGDFNGSVGSDSDAFLCKYSDSGTFLWSRVLENPERDQGLDVSADGFGNVYVTGESYSDSGAAERDLFICRYNAAGALIWRKEFGTTDTECSYSVTTDNLGSIYYAGFTYGDLASSNAGSYDAFVGKMYDLHAVPEPSVLVSLLGLCLAGLWALVRRKRLPGQ